MMEGRVIAQLFQLPFERLNQLSPSAGALVALTLIFGIVVVLKIKQKAYWRCDELNQ
jgi:hypothetical protein